MQRARDRWDGPSRLLQRRRLAPIVLAWIASTVGAACGHDVERQHEEVATDELDLSPDVGLVDSTAPVITVGRSGFIVLYDHIWCTQEAAPTLTGTVTDESPVTMQALVAGNLVDVPVSGGAWAIPMPPGGHGGLTEVRITATDAAGNSFLAVAVVRRDLEPPALSFFSSYMLDESYDKIWFNADQTVEHDHHGAYVDLSNPTGCTPITKFSYLLGATLPEYVHPNTHLNPLRFHFTVDDQGVGIVPESVQFRVGRRSGVQTSWVLDWTSAGPGHWDSPVKAWFPILLHSDQVAGLTTTPGIYDVEFRAADRFGHTATTRRCFDLILRASPLEIVAHSGTRPTKDHAYALDSLSLAPGAPFEQLAARLLNHDATGASLIDQDVINRTTSTIYLTVEVTPPAAVTVTKSFVLDNALTNVKQIQPSASELDPIGGPLYFPAVTSVSETSIDFPVKVFELAGGALGAELPCLAPCPPSGHVFRFALPPRASGGQPPRAFRVMSMIGQVPALWPQDAMHPASPPFAEDAITWMNASGTTTTTARLTGRVDRSFDPERTGCVKYAFLQGDWRCIRRGTLVPYRALTSAALTFPYPLKTRYGTAAIADVAPRSVGTERVRSPIPEHAWSTSEGALP